MNTAGTDTAFRKQREIRSPSPRRVRLAAVGDLLMPTGFDFAGNRRRPELVAPEVRELFAACDVVFGNLECTLPGSATIATEPLVIATPELIRGVGSAGFNVVTLANNHAFDCFTEGFHRVRDLLGELGVTHFGAGEDEAAAAAPAIVEVNGLRLAFLGAADERSGTRPFAEGGRFGVARLDVAQMTKQVADLRRGGHLVIVSLHWGEERFAVPSPEQIEQAHALVEAGASMVLGHHPHVLQGMEVYRGSPILYSLGNFLAENVGFTDGYVIRWPRSGRTGCIALAELSAEGVRDVRCVPTYDPGDLVGLDHTRFGPRRIARTSRAVAGGVTLRRYRHEHLWVKTLRPALDRLRWSRLKTLRLRHVRKALHHLLEMRRAR